MRLLDRILSPGPPQNDDVSRRALVTGSLAAGAVLTSFLLHRIRRRRASSAGGHAPAFDAAIREIEIMEGRCRYYAREGRGVPIVLIHSINAAASSYEMKPLFEHLCSETRRPVYALDWFGFGLSDRPPVDYSPQLYQRQLRRFLSEVIHQPADVVAYSLGCEFAALTAASHPFLFRRIVMLAPTALGQDEGDHPLRRLVVGASKWSGLFEVAFNQLVQPGTLRRFYERQIFAEGSRVPDDLVAYADLTTKAPGASHAPATFIAGTLFSGERARKAYAALQVPALLIIPTQGPSSLQTFEQLDEVLGANAEYVSALAVKTGLMPQWEAPGATAEHVLTFTLK